jgi:ribosomal protein S18 acetylase RimI-like enzyme
VAEQGHPIDHANDTAQFEILNRDQINNLQSATVDQLVSDNIPEEHRNALSDFTVQAGIDEMRNKPNLLDGVRGYVDYMDSNLANKDSLLASADKVVDEHLALAASETHGFDQQAILGMVDKIGRDAQHPFTVPEEVKEHIRLINGIENYEKLSKEEFEKYEKTGSEKYLGNLKTINMYLETYKNKLKEEPLLNAIDELNKIKSVLIPESKISISHPFDSKTTDLLTTKYGNIKLSINDTSQYETHGSRRVRQPPKSIQVLGVSVDGKYKGRGYGKKLYIEAINHALNKGLKYVSDSTLSEDAMRVYRSLEKMGYRFEEETDLTTNQFSGGNAEKYISKNNEPIFKLISAPLESKAITKIDKRSLEYQRLQDLAEVWPAAQTLLDRIHLEEEIRSQEAYRDLARQMLDIADSNAGAAAKVENVNGYMEARTKQRIDEPNPRAELIELAKKNEVPADADAMVAEHDQMVNSFDHEETKKEYELARDKYSEFKKSGNIFQNFIKCVIGSQK